jgi:hypothetical protein
VKEKGLVDLWFDQLSLPALELTLAELEQPTNPDVLNEPEYLDLIENLKGRIERAQTCGMKTELYQVRSLRFVAGFIVEDGVCTKAAPILKRFVGWTLLECQNSVKAHRWQLSGPIMKGLNETTGSI